MFYGAAPLRGVFFLYSLEVVRCVRCLNSYRSSQYEVTENRIFGLSRGQTILLRSAYDCWFWWSVCSRLVVFVLSLREALDLGWKL
uniref:Putative secreted protein n=1 Tax=Anopheles darlingi TaxID=43151 RepID=A0A2M4DEK3_ANODA